MSSEDVSQPSGDLVPSDIRLSSGNFPVSPDVCYCLLPEKERKPHLRFPKHWKKDKGRKSSEDHWTFDREEDICTCYLDIFRIYIEFSAVFLQPVSVPCVCSVLFRVQLFSFNCFINNLKEKTFWMSPFPNPTIWWWCSSYIFTGRQREDEFWV